MDGSVVWMAIAGAVLGTIVGLRFRKHISRFDPFGQYLRSGGKMLPDYDAENDFIDKYSK